MMARVLGICIALAAATVLFALWLLGMPDRIELRPAFQIEATSEITEGRRPKEVVFYAKRGEIYPVRSCTDTKNQYFIEISNGDLVGYVESRGFTLSRHGVFERFDLPLVWFCPKYPAFSVP
jgi:hypothetical protein